MLRKKHLGRSHSSVAQSTAIRKCVTEVLEPRIMLAAHILGSNVSYSTIQAAVNAAKAGAVINVDAGAYPEMVTINKSLTIRGAQAGVDARSNARQLPAAESTMTGANLGGSTSSSFYINANDVTIDGFTVQGNTSASQYGAGIVIAPNRAGAHVLDNIVQNNISGLDLSNNSATDAAVIQHNVFRNNNNAGDNGGRGIYTDESFFGAKLTNVTIDANAFYGNRGSSGTTGLEAAVAIEPNVAGITSNIRITNNVMDYNGKAVLFFHTTGVTITGNTITNCQDKYSGSLRFEGDDANVTISNNTVYDNTGPGVAVDAKGVPGNDSGFVVTGNNFYNNSTGYGSGISVIVNDGSYDGVFDARNNWWGSASGPSGDGPGTGDGVWGNGNVVSGQQWATAPGGNALYSPWSTKPNGPEEAPYWGLASTDGSPIQAEDFDHGGNGVGYFTTATSNAGGGYRPNERIGIEATSDTGGGYDVGWTAPGEWLAYSVNATQSANYRFDFRIANGQSTAGTFHIAVDGQNVSGTLSAPPTGGWQNWQTISSAAIPISAGPHVIELVCDSGGSSGAIANFNWLKFTNVAASQGPLAPSNLAAATGGTSQINLTWTNNAANQTGFKIDRSTDGVNFTTIATVGAAATSYSDSGLAAGTTYYYRVRATSASGDSPNSNVAQAATTSLNSVTYVSDLQWASATVGWGTIGIDSSIKGNPITLRGTVYAKGIGTHAASRIVYNLNGQYTSFVSDVGVDDEVSGQGAVDFQVLGDGKVLFDSGVLTGQSPVVHVNVSVAGVQQLTLVATNGIAGSIDYDHADWAGAELLTSAPAAKAPTAPANLTAVASTSTQINLAWANTDGSTTSFEIDRSSDGVTFAKLANVASNVTTYSDKSLPASTTYYYRVVAINSVGASPASSTAQATTLALESVQYISALQWTSATVGWGTIGINTSIKGNPITLRGTTYAQGIGTHADSTITYNLAGQYKTFVSDIGIDDEVNGQGSVIFQVIGDGRVLFNSGTLTGASPVMNVNVDVTGVQQLQLVATTATPGDIDYDHADWAGAKLLV